MTINTDLQRSIPAIGLDVSSRARFIMRTYAHLVGAILGFTALEIFYFQSGLAYPIASFAFNSSWLLILGAFIIVSWLASRTAHRAQSLATQYLALAGFVFAESLIFVPLLFIANMQAPGVISSAALVTLMGFVGLTAVVFTTRKDFSFMGSILRWGFVVAIVLIVASLIFGFELGTFFSVAMIGLAGGGHSLRHLQGAAHLPRRPLRRRRAGIVCFGGAALLVRAAALYVARLTFY